MSRVTNRRNTPAFFVPTVRMDRETFEGQEDLDRVLGDLDPQLLMTMDMRGAVIVALDADMTVGVQRRVLPFAAVELALRQRFQRR
jgi:hypothetical protein